MSRNWILALAVVIGLALAVPTSAQLHPAFTNGPLVARKMERHYNGATYKAKLAAANSRLTSRVLCAYDKMLRYVECDGKANIPAASGSARYVVTVHWELEKRTATRAKLTWMMRSVKNASIFQTQHEIIGPKAYGLTRF